MSRRTLLAFAVAAGLAIGIAIPSAAIGETQVTLNCSDGTNVTLVVDVDTLTGLTQAVQAMIDYPAGLTCTLIKSPVVMFGGFALAAPGTSPFIVGGGRWLATCELIVPPPPCPDPNAPGCGGSAEGGVVARVPGAWSYTANPPTGMVFVNIAVNFHQASDGSFFGTLNETIPANQSCPGGFTSESHFTSKPEASFTGCFARVDNTKAVVRSHVTQTSGAPFPGAALNTDITFSFIDNGNPGQQTTTDKLQGPPEADTSNCPAPSPDPADPHFSLENGNITLHPKPV